MNKTTAVSSDISLENDVVIGYDKSDISFSHSLQQSSSNASNSQSLTRSMSSMK